MYVPMFQMFQPTIITLTQALAQAHVQAQGFLFLKKHGTLEHFEKYE
jgi:hypothetical protein